MASLSGAPAPARRSSISSSKPLLGAWILCAGILIAVEAVLHLLPAKSLLSYNMFHPDTDPTFQYLMVSRITTVYEKPQVLVMGSSRVREAIVIPLLCEKLGLRGVSQAQCRNYGLPSARMSDLYALLKMLRRSGKTPDVIVLGVTPFELGEHHDEPPVGFFFTLRDVFSNTPGLPLGKLLRSLPVVCHGIADRRLRTLWLREIVRIPGHAPTNLLGGMSYKQATCLEGRRKGREQSLLNVPSSFGQITGYMRHVEFGGTWYFPYVNFQSTVELFRLAAECGSRIVVIELPVSRALRAAYPDGKYEAFLYFYETRCRRAGVPFIGLQDLGVVTTDKDMYDFGHLNLTGAEKFTSALAVALEKYLRPEGTVDQSAARAVSAAASP